MLNVGGPELLIILLVALVFLGPQRLPELARQLGQAASSLRSLASGFQAELEAASRPDPEPSMKLDGPTSRDEAIAKTQPGKKSAADPESATAHEPAAAGDTDAGAEDGVAADPFAGKTAATDPAKIAAEARQVSYDDEDVAVSEGGPSDLTATSVDADDQHDGEPVDSEAAEDGRAPGGGT